MKLVTQAIARELYAADQQVIETGGAPDKIVAKFFTPWASATWFITSGTPVDQDGEPTTIENAKDWHLFGFADLGDRLNAELGYVMLSDLESLKGPFGLKVERDLHYSSTMSQVLAKYGREAA